MTNTKNAAVAYYTALGEKNIEKVGLCLHPDVSFTDPQETKNGKDAVLEAAAGFMKIFKSLKIRAQFGAEDQAMIVYDVEIPTFANKLLAASLLNFKEGLISKIELFYDTQGFSK